jgi:hypothetical protein
MWICRPVPRRIGLACLLAVTTLASACQLQQWMNDEINEAEVSRVLGQLRSADEDRRKAALEELAALEEAELSFASQQRLIRAAAEEWKDSEEGDVSASILEVALSGDGPYWELVTDHFAQFSEEARLHVLNRLNQHGDGKSAITYLALVEKYGGVVPSSSLVGFVASPHAMKRLFPQVLERHKENLVFDHYLFALRALQGDKARSAQFAPFQETMLARYREARDRMRPKEAPKGDDWIWEEQYSADRALATLLLDLMTFGSGPGIQKALDEALTSRDARMRHFAVMSKLRHGASVDAAVITSVAANAEMRNWLFDELSELGKRHLFPQQFATQASFAESDMVRWLAYPTELGRTPHEIELMKTFENKKRTERYYLFRFRTREPHSAAKDGWMSGVSGPFTIAEMPTTEAGGSTFSEFTRWDEMTPEQHFKEITGETGEEVRGEPRVIVGPGDTQP